MSEQDRLFERLSRQAEGEAKSDFARYRRKLIAYTLLGYLILFGTLATLIGLVVGSVALAASYSWVFLLLVKKKLVLVLLPMVWVLGRALWVRIDAPEGYELKAEAHPRLFAAIEKMREAAGAPKIHRIILDGELNAAVAQTPRLGIFGWPRNTLILGLPLLFTLSSRQAQAVVAHELGHLSGNHGKFSTWIYRVRLTWYRLMEAFRHEDNLGAKAMRGFFDWYAPRYAAYAFPLIRRNEYEADQVAAELTSAEYAGQALVRIHVQGSRLEEGFWGYYSALQREHATPPHPPWSGMLEYYRRSTTQPEGAVDYQARLAEALACKTDYADTHPALTDRLAALDVEGTLPDTQGRSAAERWFGEALPRILKEFDAAWMARNAEAWREGHVQIVAAQKELDGLLALPFESLDAESLAKLGRLQLMFEQNEAAQRSLGAYQQRFPEMDEQGAEVAFLLARIAFARAEYAQTLAQLRSALAWQEGFIEGLYPLAYNALSRLLREEEYLYWREEGQQRLQRLNAGEEDPTLWIDHEVALHSLDADDPRLVALRQFCAGHAAIRELAVAERAAILGKGDAPVVVVVYALTVQHATQHLQTFQQTLAELLQRAGAEFVLQFDDSAGDAPNTIAKRVQQAGIKLV